MTEWEQTLALNDCRKELKTLRQEHERLQQKLALSTDRRIIHAENELNKANKELLRFNQDYDALEKEHERLKEENAKVRRELSEVEYRLASQLTAATQLMVAGQEQLSAVGDDQHPGAYAVMMADRDGYKREASQLKAERDSLSRQVKIAVEAIEKAPHANLCDHHDFLGCDCWKKKALSEIEKEKAK